jgi:alpha-methylacyl-CoA racemase
VSEAPPERSSSAEAPPERTGPLRGLRVVEFAGLGPAPFAGMMLADFGAEVVRIDRKGSTATGHLAVGGRGDVLGRGRRSIALDLKHPGAIGVAMQLIQRADALIEGYRPGVMEGLGLGPAACHARNPRLVYGRATGWGQDGPLSRRAGHDVNYIALSGALHSMARRGERPLPVPGFVADFGGGGMVLAFGMVAAMLEAARSGRGQVVDAAACEGSALLAALIYGWRSVGLWHAQAGTNNGDSGAHFYETYRCRDGRYVSVGAIEPAFYAQLRARCGLDDPDFDGQWDEARWPRLKDKLAAVFATRTRDEWCEVFEGSDACFAPVLDLDEAPGHPQHVARGSFVRVDGVVQPAPAPRLDRTPAAAGGVSPRAGAHTDAILGELGLNASAIAALHRDGAVAGAAAR